MGGGVPLSAAAHRQWSEREVQAYVLAEQIARLHADALGRRRAAHPHAPYPLPLPLTLTLTPDPNPKPNPSP